MTKRILALVLAALLLGAVALAEVTGPLFEAERMSDTNATDSDLFIYTENWLEGLVDREGNVMAVAQFGDLSYANCGYFEATNEGGFNTSALVDTAGAALTPYEYSDFTVVSPNWAIGVVLEGTNDKDGSDYSVIFGDYNYAVVVRNDVFYLPEKKLVGTLERAQFRSAREAGTNGWLLVEDRNGAITAYDPEFNATPTEMRYLSDAEFVVKSDSDISPKALYSVVTGEQVSDKAYDGINGIGRGYAAYYDSNSHLYGILDPQGNEICAPAYVSVYSTLFDDRYVKVTQKREDGVAAEGLFDLVEGSLAVPCLYERVYTWGDKSPINNGYICVEENGKLGFIDTNGEVTCPIQYAKDGVDYYGCTLGAIDLTGAVTIVAADGTVTPLEGVTELAIKNSLTDSDGYFLVVKNAEGNQGVVDWHGNQVIDFALDYNASIYGGDCLFTGTSLYQLER